mgnify:CR=1 FL=1
MRFFHRYLIALLLLTPGLLAAQSANPSPRKALMTLDEAIQIGLVNNYLLRSAALGQSEVNSQVEEGFSNLYPRINLSGNYQRNLLSSNPFAGSSAGNIFTGLGQIGWLGYNEQARTDNDDSTVPITLQEYYRRIAEGQTAAGIPTNSSANPFAVENNFTGNIAISQTLYNAAIGEGLRATRVLQSITASGFLRQQQQIVSQIRSAFYRVMLAREQVSVLQNSMERLAETTRDVGKTVQQGLAPRFQRLSAEVELGNLNAQKIVAANNAGLALSGLKLLLGLPMETEIDIKASWEEMTEKANETDGLNLRAALDVAMNNRPDLVQAQKNIVLQEIQKGVTTALGKPIVSAFSNISYLGRVPSNRTYSVQDTNDPFKFTKERNRIFSDGYWDPNITIGLQVSWSLYDGGTRKYQRQRNQLSIERAKIQEVQLQESIRLEVEQAFLSLSSASERITSQRQNIARAEENYRITSTRLREGVGNQLEERQASELLDQSKLAYVVAIFDYLNAKNSLQTAMGKLPFVESKIPEFAPARTGGIWNYVNKFYKVQ